MNPARLDRFTTNSIHWANPALRVVLRSSHLHTVRACYQLLFPA
jgi:hypothetical protein